MATAGEHELMEYLDSLAERLESSVVRLERIAEASPTPSPQEGPNERPAPASDSLQ
jgi:hypothetical protein